MLYSLFRYLDQLDIPGAGVFKYISFRAAAATILSLIVTIWYGKIIINYLRNKQVGETVRALGLSGENLKQGTPTMGGLIIIGGILIPVLLFAQLTDIYIQLLIAATLWLGLIGFLDDYIKVFKKDKKGLHGKFKIVGQIGLGIIVGTGLYFDKDVKVREYLSKEVVVIESQTDKKFAESLDQNIEKSFIFQDVKSTKTTIPFFKNNELDYSKLLPQVLQPYTWIFYVLIVIFIITAVSNGANITDGIDGLAAGTSAIIGLTLGILAYVSGNTVFSQYLNIMYIPGSGELVIFCAAFVGACIGFLWYNTYPAQVFMGDTGSLALGGIIAVIALCIRKELMLPLLCGIFLIENLSVIIQVAYFKYTKKKYGEGKRIFKMSPLHHHYQKLDYHESKIVTRFWIVGIALAALTLATLKLR
jgi:phospho-N-acetylmuramoyl-pentapeptide-transferase